MLALVEPRLAAVVTPRPSGLALAQAALPLIDLVSLPEPPTKRRLVAIPEDGVMGYEQQRIQHCMELVAKRLADFSGHYVLHSQFSEALLVASAFAYCFEELFGVDGKKNMLINKPLSVSFQPSLTRALSVLPSPGVLSPPS